MLFVAKPSVGWRVGAQDTLTDEMVTLAAGLKRNAQAMQQSVTQRGALLEDTDAAIEHNLAATKKSVKRSKEEHKRCAAGKPQLEWRCINAVHALE